MTSIFGLFMESTDDFIKGGKTNKFWLFIFMFPIVFPILRIIAF